MTIVCFRSGIMAADSAVWSGETIAGHTTKIVRTPRGDLVAAAGETTICEQFRAWAIDNAPSKADGVWDGFYPECGENDDFEGLIVDPTGRIICIDREGRSEAKVRLDFVAIGAASGLALGSLLAGASAEDAVKICIENHAFAGGTMQVEYLDRNRKPPLSPWVADAVCSQAHQIIFSPSALHFPSGVPLQ